MTRRVVGGREPGASQVRVVAPWSAFRRRTGTVVGTIDGDVLVQLDGELAPLRFSRDAIELIPSEHQLCEPAVTTTRRVESGRVVSSPRANSHRRTDTGALAPADIAQVRRVEAALVRATRLVGASSPAALRCLEGPIANAVARLATTSTSGAAPGRQAPRESLATCHVAPAIGKDKRTANDAAEGPPSRSSDHAGRVSPSRVVGRGASASISRHRIHPTETPDHD